MPSPTPASNRLRHGFLVCAVVAGVVAPTSAVMADDGGLGAFFREQFGIGQEPQAAPQPGYGEDETRPLIVRPHRRRTVSRPQPTKVVVGPVAPVSIYEDKTLRPGDAVMTAKGVRVFVGGHATPYTEADFAALSDAEGLPRQIEKALVVIDKAPRI